MPTGVLIECAAVLVGGAVGALLGKGLPQRICEVLNLIFSLSALSMGIVSVVKVSVLPPVILSVLLGTVLGELCRLEAGIAAGFGRLNAFLGRHCRLFSDKGRPEDYMSRFVSIVVLFCMSGTGIFGALQAGISGDNTILFTKAILDLFTAAVFAASLGFMVSLISLPPARDPGGALLRRGGHHAAGQRGDARGFYSLRRDPDAGHRLSDHGDQKFPRRLHDPLHGPRRAPLRPLGLPPRRFVIFCFIGAFKARFYGGRNRRLTN